MSNIITSFEKFNESQDENMNLDEKRKLFWKQNTHEIVVPQFKEKSFKKLMKKLTRFSTTLGFPVPTSNVKEVRTQYIVHSNVNGDWSEKLTTWDKDEAEKSSKKSQNSHVSTRLWDVIDITIVDEVRPLEDWIILGTIDYKDGLVKPAPGQEVPMDLLQDINLSGSSYCAHCKKTLRRNKTVFVKNTEDDEIKQIGGTCTKYYLGLDFKKIMGYLESLHELSGTEEIDPDEMRSFSYNFEAPTYSVDTLIKYYIWWVRENKSHVSKKAAEAYNQKIEDQVQETGDSDTRERLYGKMKRSTGQQVIDKVIYVNAPPSTRGMKSYDASSVIQQWEEDVKLFDKQISTVTEDEIKEIYDFIDSKKTESNFMFNVNNKVAEGYLEAHLLNYVSGACSFFFGIRMAEEMKRQREEARRKSNEDAAKKSSHIGVIGEKSAFEDIEIKRIGGFETQYGWNNVYTMEDSSGNVITKFGTITKKFITNDSEEIEAGAVISFTADIKQHTDYNGVPQTVIGRLSKFNPKLKY